MEGANRTLGAPGAPPPPGTSAFDVGATLGAYRLLQLLGEGGMGRVFLAEHTKLGRRVAIKVLRAEYAFQPDATQRFFAEARVVNQINHEHVVEIIDFIEGEGAEKYYVMELLRGRSLRELLDAGPIPLERTLAIADQMCDALIAVHESQVVHRDLKPDNVFLIERNGNTDFVKLLDFGVAKLLDAPSRKANQTAAGGLLGTPEYMAPEQLSGKPVDARADIYAVGVMLYELVSGAKPFTADSFGEIVVQHLTQLPQPLPGNLPAWLRALILQCLEKQPAARPASMREVRSRLAEASDAPVKSPRKVWPFVALFLIAALAIAAYSQRHRFIVKAPPPVTTEVAPPAPEPAPVVEEPAPTLPAVVEKQAEPIEPPKKKKRVRKVDRGGLIDPYKQ